MPPLYGAALELLDRLLRDFPDPPQLAAAHQQRARCLAAVGRSVEALEVYRSALQAECDHPGVRVNAYLEFAELVLALRRADFYSEALALLAERASEQIFPLDRYRSSAAAALLCDELALFVEARAHATQALAAAATTESPLPRHKVLGLVDKTEVDVQARL